MGVGVGCHFFAFKGLFLRSMYRLEIFFWVAKISIIIWVCLIILIFLYGKQ